MAAPGNPQPPGPVADGARSTSRSGSRATTGPAGRSPSVRHGSVRRSRRRPRGSTVPRRRWPHPWSSSRHVERSYSELRAKVALVASIWATVFSSPSRCRPFLPSRPSTMVMISNTRATIPKPGPGGKSQLHQHVGDRDREERKKDPDEGRSRPTVRRHCPPAWQWSGFRSSSARSGPGTRGRRRRCRLDQLAMLGSVSDVSAMGYSSASLRCWPRLSRPGLRSLVNVRYPVAVIIDPPRPPIRSGTATAKIRAALASRAANTEAKENRQARRIRRPVRCRRPIPR